MPIRAMDGFKVIGHNADGTNLPDDPAYPFRLEVTLRPPEGLPPELVRLRAGEDEKVVVLGLTKEILEGVVKRNKVCTNDRLLHLVITNSVGDVVKEIKKHSSR